MTLAQETLGFRRTGFSPVLSLLTSAYALPEPPGLLTVSLHRRLECSPTDVHHRSDDPSRSFGAWLEPRYIFGADSLD